MGWECKTQAFASLEFNSCCERYFDNVSIYLAVIKRDLNKHFHTLIINKHFDTLIIWHLVPWPTRENRRRYSTPLLNTWSEMY